MPLSPGLTLCHVLYNKRAEYKSIKPLTPKTEKLFMWDVQKSKNKYVCGTMHAETSPSKDLCVLNLIALNIDILNLTSFSFKALVV